MVSILRKIILWCSYAVVEGGGSPSCDWVKADTGAVTPNTEFDVIGRNEFDTM